MHRARHLWRKSNRIASYHSPRRHVYKWESQYIVCSSSCPSTNATVMCCITAVGAYWMYIAVGAEERPNTSQVCWRCCLVFSICLRSCSLDFHFHSISYFSPTAKHILPPRLWSWAYDCIHNALLGGRLLQLAYIANFDSAHESLSTLPLRCLFLASAGKTM